MYKYINKEMNNKKKKIEKKMNFKVLTVNFKCHSFKAMQGYLSVYFYDFHYYSYLFICLFMHLYTFEFITTFGSLPGV